MSESMTREQIMAMVPGRELDRLVGKHVMNLDVVEDTLPQLPKYYLPEYHRTIYRDVPLYSSDITTAWEVVEKMKEKVDTMTLVFASDSWACHFTLFIPGNEDEEYSADFKEWEFDSPSAPEAICKAALLAVMDL